jgi:cell division protein FtsX
MKLRTIEADTKTGNVILFLEVGEKGFVDGDDEIGSVTHVNEITFPSKEDAKKYFEKVYKQNKNIIENNKERLQQIDGDILKINDFVQVIEKSNALSKRNSEKIEDLIDGYHTTKNLERNIKDTEETNKINEEILTALKDL